MRDRLAYGVLLAVGIVDAIGYGIIGPIVPAISDATGGGPAVMGALVAMFGIGMVIGFWFAGVPGVFVLGMATFFLSVVPFGPAILWVPAALWLNASGSTGMAIFMAIWGLVIVGGSENIVRPLLIGKGVEAPMALVFLGVIGGILAFGFLGLFIGPTLLTLAYNLLKEWMGEAEPT